MGDGQPRWVDQVRGGIRRKHYSIWTEQAYVEGNRRFVLHYNKRHPRDMRAAEVEAFPTYLAAAKWVPLFLGPSMFFPILRGQWGLFLGAYVSLAIALLHVVVVLIGPDAYGFFGGPGLARQAESGSWQPAFMTLVLAWLFVVFAAYGLSGAGVIRRLPLLAGVLLLIGGLYTVRGLSIVGQMAQYLSTPGSPPLRAVLYSLVALLAGLCYLGGTVQGWEHLTGMYWRSKKSPTAKACWSAPRLARTTTGDRSRLALHQRRDDDGGGASGNARLRRRFA